MDTSDCPDELMDNTFKYVPCFDSLLKGITEDEFDELCEEYAEGI